MEWEMDVAEWPTAHSRHEALVPHLGDDTGLMGTTRDMLDVECTHTHTYCNPMMRPQRIQVFKFGNGYILYKYCTNRH